MKTVFISVLILSLASFVQAKDPSAAQILEKALKAMGGPKALEKVQTRHATGTVTVRGYSGTYQMWAKAPDRIKTQLDLGVFRQERAYDGTRGWQKQTSVEEILGPELERLKRTAIFHPLLNYWKNKTPAENKGKHKVGDKECYLIEIRPAEGSAETFCFDTKSYYLLRETRRIQVEGKDQELVLEYGQYRKVNGLLLPYSIKQILPDQVLALRIDSYKLNEPTDDSLFKSPLELFADVPYEVTLSTIPRSVYKENDGVWGPGTTESWVVHIVVQEKHMRPLEPVAAKVELYSDEELVKIMEFSPDALETLRGTSFAGFNNVEEVFDLRHSFSEPVALEVNKMVYKLNLLNSKNEKIQKRLEIPLQRYELKTKLIFPIKGPFLIAGGHDVNEPHKQEWSQHYACDIVGLGPNYEVTRKEAGANEDFYGWGREVVAVADGKVVYARDDVPDNSRPGTIDQNLFMNLPDPMRAFAGNNIVIDHGNNEFSFYGHLQHGSVKVKTGDSVKQGDVIALTGNSGNSDGPHLHFHLMSGDTVFRSDGLPSSFENVELVLFTTEKQKVVTPKRGLLLEAK